MTYFQSRPAALAIVAAVAAAMAVPAAAQTAEPITAPVRASPPERIDLLEQNRAIAEEEAGDELENCSEINEAGSISGEIVVCRRRADDTAVSGFDKEAWEDRYAAETRGADPVNVDGPGIFQGAPTIGGLCIPGLQKCPPPPAIVVDFSALPEAPPGSDADRIARGLPPLGRDTAITRPAPATDAARAEALGLPPTPDFADDDGAEAPVSPAESAAPAAPR